MAGYCRRFGVILPAKIPWLEGGKVWQYNYGFIRSFFVQEREFLCQPLMGMEHLQQNGWLLMLSGT